MEPLTPERLESALAEIVRRVVEVAEPERILLFGSAARGERGPHSDVDLLVVTRVPMPRGRLTEEIYLHLIGSACAVDVVVVTPDDVERYQDSPYHIIGTALGEGEVLYERLISLSNKRGL